MLDVPPPTPDRQLISQLLRTLIEHCGRPNRAPEAWALATAIDAAFVAEVERQHEAGVVAGMTALCAALGKAANGAADDAANDAKQEELRLMEDALETMPPDVTKH
jgi:hypothetical protein